MDCLVKSQEVVQTNWVPDWRKRWWNKSYDTE